MIGDWTIQHLPRCTHHAFLSHCAEDRNRLARPIFDRLSAAYYSIWFDEHDYPAGQGAFEALREGIVHCRHVVHLVTAKFLGQGRGWNSVENAYSALLQENLRFSSLEICHIHLPLFFVPPSHPVLRRSAWAPHLHRGRFYPAGRVDDDAVEWTVGEIIEFIREKERRGVALAEQLQNDPGAQKLLTSEPNLLRRVMCADPVPLP
ncbi:MAG: toll/interleukin-1 receptor domain-containing protein [Planctomycetaceae bacterium]